MSPLRLSVAHRPLKHPVVVSSRRHVVHGKEVFPNESIASWTRTIRTGVITICKGKPKQVEPKRAGCGIHQNQNGNMLGKLSSDTSNGKLQAHMTINLLTSTKTSSDSTTEGIRQSSGVSDLHCHSP